MRPGCGDRDRRRLHEVFRSPGELDLVLARRQHHRLAALPINLGMEEEIGRETAAGRGIDPPHPVAEDERCHRRPAVLITNIEDERHRGLAVEKDVDITPEPQVLRALTDVEADPRFPFARIPAMDLHDPVLEAQPGERTLEWTILIHDHIGPALDDLGGADRFFRIRAAGRLAVEGSGIGAVRRPARP